MDSAASAQAGRRKADMADNTAQPPIVDFAAVRDIRAAHREAVFGVAPVGSPAEAKAAVPSDKRGWYMGTAAVFGHRGFVPVQTDH